MRKKKKYNRKRINAKKRRQTVKTAVAVFLVMLVAVTALTMCRSQGTQLRDEVRGVWVSYVDFAKLGLSNKSETEFRENAAAFYDRAEELHINTVYFHVRAFRDAVYKSEYFPVSKAIWSRSEAIPYDPLEIMAELADEYEMELHAWMNPYRNSSFEEAILDPADEASTEDILLCVNELLDNYDIDGIHFDDYFYKEGDPLSASEKMANVNRMVQRVYEEVHSHKGGAVFGISPAGNTGYSESIGADVRTWLSEDGYVDYIVPQIYWTDEHTAAWRDRMFSDTLDEWQEINVKGKPVYIGLALYKTGKQETDDPGWITCNSNIEFQIRQLREKNCGGYVFFSASDLFREGAAEELKIYQKLEF